MSVFAQRVYKLVSQIPKGRVSSYKQVAKALNCLSFQAVGQALKNNPNPPTIPCHRIVKSDGSIGGFNGKRSGKEVLRKIKLLEKEGIRFNGKKIKGFKAKLYKF